MPLTPDTKLGQYEVVESIGAGGMGEVYRARDTKLGRDVAIKVLPEEFARDRERLDRFEREARLLAQINHANIATLHGLEEHDGQQFLVMELVEGETLAERIAQGPLPVGEAIPLFIQIAEGLEAAHEKGIVHRDLKPANIKIGHDGKPKILDFGLAKAFEGEAAGQDLSQSPTLTKNATETGVVQGTAPYMSPEQARGIAVDERTDIWAFGCCLFEALRGGRAFVGDTVSDTIAQILKTDPDWSRLPVLVSPNLQRLMARCLTKKPHDRLHHIADVRIGLQESASAEGGPRETKRSTTLRERVAWLLAGVFFVTAIMVSNRAPDDTEVIRFSIEPPGSIDDRPVLSPAGRHVAFGARGPSGEQQLWVRSLDESTPALLTESKGDQYLRPFWSPDGGSVAYFAEGKLNTVRLSGGAVQTMSPAPFGRGGTWNEAGDIVFQPSNRDPLYRLKASGGASTPVTQIDTSLGENSHRWPQFLPDGRHFLFTARAAEPENTAIYVGSLGSTDRRRLITAQSNAVYSPPGYILFAREGNLFAQAFDLDRFQLTGEAVPVVDGVYHNYPSAYAHFSISADGRILAYQSDAALVRQLAWFDRRGQRVEDVGPPGEDYEQVRISPLGTEVALTRPDIQTGNRDVWLMDLVQGVPSRLTFGNANDWYPVFSPNGDRIAFASDRNGASSVYVKDLSREIEEDLWRSPGSWPMDWTEDERLALKAGAGVSILSMGGELEETRLVEGDFNNKAVRVSPGGKWAAYVSDASGRMEIYLRSVDTERERNVPVRQLSSSGGNHPRWSGTENELFYLELDGTLMRVPLELGTDVKALSPEPLFETCARDLNLGAGGQPYDVSRDGQRFLFICRPRDATHDPYYVIFGWQHELERLVPTH